MRLDFNVLWIDDQPDNVDGYIYLMEPAFEDEGFKLNVTPALSLAEAERYLGDSVFIDDIDLVLVDFNLGNAESGDVAVRQIRNRVPYKDIIFYSAIPTNELMEKILSQKVEGVFCAHRDHLPERVTGIFRSLIKKVLDIDHCRGIVMGVTSDIDQIVIDCLVALEAIISDDHRNTTYEYVKKNFDTRLSRFQSVRDQIDKGMPMAEMLKSHEAVPAADRIRLLKKVIDLHFSDTNDEIRNAVSEYLKVVPNHRNILGHVRLVAKGARRALRGSGNREVNADELRAMRQQLIVYRDRFEDLAKALGLSIDAFEGTDSSINESSLSDT